jgi:hypothetical protein
MDFISSGRDEGKIRGGENHSEDKEIQKIIESM